MGEKSFGLGAILSVIAEKKLASDAEIQELLNYMVGYYLYYYELQDAALICSMAILQQYPKLNEIDYSSLTPVNWDIFLSEQMRKYGSKLEIKILEKE